MSVENLNVGQSQFKLKQFFLELQSETWDHFENWTDGKQGCKDRHRSEGEKNQKFCIHA